MDDFLKELGELLIKYHACIVRSASENHELVACIVTKENGGVRSQEATFEEEISDSSIQYGWYKEETNCWTDNHGITSYGDIEREE